MAPDGYKLITNEFDTVQPGDLYRVREDERSEYGPWQPTGQLAGSEAGYFASWHSQNIQFCRPSKPAVQAALEAEWEPLPIEEDTVLQPGRDEVRFRAGRGEWSAWVPLSGGPLSVTFFVAQRPSFYEYEFRRRRNWTPPAPEQPPSPTPDRGSKYHRTITQTLPGDTHGLALTIDVYDVLQAFGVTCPALQHAVKKLLCAGLRGSKSAEQDIGEAANSCRRAIELLGAGL